MEDNEEDHRNVQELFTRGSCTANSTAHHHSHQNHASGEPCSRCECSLMYNVEPTQDRRRKKKYKLQHCPSCHCHVDIRKGSSTRTRNVDDIEAVMEKTEHIFNDSYKTGGIKKSHSSPLSPKSTPKCYRNNGHTYCSKKTSGNCNRQQQQQQQRRSEEDEKITALLNEIVKSGVENEQTEYSDKYVNFTPIRSLTKKDCHWKNDQLSQDMQDYSDVENDCCVEKCCENHHRTKKCEALKESWKRRENDWIEEDDEERLKRECREFAKLKHGSRECRKSKNLEDQRCKEDHSSNAVEQLERRKTFVNDETRRKKKERNFTSKLPVPHVDSKSPDRVQTSMTKSNVDRQRNDKNVQWIEASTSYHCFNGKTHDDFSRDEELRKELENIPYSKPCHRSTTGRSAKFVKSFEATDQDDRNVNEKHEDSVVPVKADQTNNEDLDLHASKSHILSLIDRALSKEFAPLDDKKCDQMKEEVTRQELFIEISRALQGDCCHSLAQNLLSHRGTPDYVRHLKTLRWEYLNHIQDKLRKLYDLEKILDDCSSPRHSLSTLQSHTSNTDHQLKHCARAQISHQQEQKESTS